MKKEFVGFLVLICLVFSGMFVSAEMISTSSDGYNYDVKVLLNQGWNLVLTFDLKDLSPMSDIKSEDIAVTWMYSSDDKKYWQFYPDKSEFDSTYSENKLSDSSDKVGRMMFSSMWIYSKKAGYLAYNRVDVPKINEVKLLQGWNFIGITPDMVGKTMNQIKGTCNYEGIYFYGTEGGKTGWGDLLNNPNFVDKEAWESANTGIGIVIKVSSDCTLGSTSSNVNPPSLPTDSSSVCTDSDGGTVSDVRGTTSANGETKQDNCASDLNLIEYDCENNAIRQNVFDCSDMEGTGFSSCQNGRCI